MSITIAKTAGFCFGVNRAVELVEQAAGQGTRVVTLGPIIHNRHAVAHFEQMGVGVIEDPDQALPTDTVIIRSHGVTKAVYDRLVERGVQIIDATCPFVKRIHDIVSKAESEGRISVIIGTPSHPEVEGIAACACVLAFAAVPAGFLLVCGPCGRCGPPAFLGRRLSVNQVAIASKRAMRISANQTMDFVLSAVFGAFATLKLPSACCDCDTMV